MNNKSTDPKSCFAKNLKDYMDTNSVSRKKLSEDLDIRYSTICEWLKGTILPRADKMELVANYFNTTSSKLLEDPNEEIVMYKYPFVSRIPDGYSLSQAADEFFTGWGIIQHKKNIVPHFGIQINHECNPMQPRYVKGDSVSFTLTNSVSEYDCDYLIRRKGHDAEIVRIYEDQNPPYIIEDNTPKEDIFYEDNKLKYYVMIPVYNIENIYEPYHTYNWDTDYEIIGKAD